MTSARADRLDRDVDPQRDHILGDGSAEVTLVEYGSYVCSYCHAAHDVIRTLRDQFGDRMRYVYRHLPLTDRHEATAAAEIVEYAAATGADFWEAHDALMSRGPVFTDDELREIAARFQVPPRDQWEPDAARMADTHVREDARSGIRSGARVTPTFFIDGRRYDGAWDEASLRDAMLGSPGHRLRTATVDFARWAPSTGVLLLLMTTLAVIMSNTTLGPAFLAFWHQVVGFSFGSASFALPLLDWINHGLLTVFFLVVGLEIKREMTIGRLSSPRAAAFPIMAAVGGMTLPALVYLLLAPAGLEHGWGITIATDTAFAVALIVLLGDRVPVDLRIFLTAAVIVDDLVAIAVVALFYSAALSAAWLALAAMLTVGLVLLNRAHVYRALPYAALGVLLWFALHEAGLHATLAGVILALVTPTRPPANLRVLLAQAQAVVDAETKAAGGAAPRTGPSAHALDALDAIHDRIESPASKLLRATEPWSSYVVLPVFALANAGVVWSPGMLDGHGALIAAIALGLVIGKPAGIILGARVVARLGIGSKPPSYTWRQVAGSGALAGIGFTMSLFIAGQSFTGSDFDAARIAIFLASLLAGTIGTLILWPRVAPQSGRGDEIGTPIESGMR
jgi:NhaA family Na+:H+ antiporter